MSIVLKTDSGDSPIIVEGFFNTSPERVFQAWTDPDIVMKWFGRVPNSLHSATIDLRPGGHWRFIESSNNQHKMGFEGTYLEIVKSERLVFTWSKFTESSDGERNVTPTSHVEVTFAEDNVGTKMRVVHSSVHDHATRTAFGMGWKTGLSGMLELFAAL